MDTAQRDERRRALAIGLAAAIAIPRALGLLGAAADVGIAAFSGPPTAAWAWAALEVAVAVLGVLLLVMVVRRAEEPPAGAAIVLGVVVVLALVSIVATPMLSALEVVLAHERMDTLGATSDAGLSLGDVLAQTMYVRHIGAIVGQGVYGFGSLGVVGWAWARTRSPVSGAS